MIARRRAQEEAERDLVLAYHVAELAASAVWGKLPPLSKLLERVRPKQRVIAEKRAEQRAGWHMISKMFGIPIRKRKKAQPDGR